MNFRSLSACLGLAALVVANPGCRARETPASAIANDASARTGVPSPAPKASEGTEALARAPSVASVDLANAPGPAPSGSAVPREVRETAALALLTDATFVRRAPLVDLEPGREFDWTLRDRVAPRIVVPMPKLRFVESSTKGGLPDEVVRRIVRQYYGRFRSCTTSALATKKNLAGRVTLELSIEPDGRLADVTSQRSTLNDAAAVRCMVDATKSLEFPKGDERTVSLQTIEFSPNHAQK